MIRKISTIILLLISVATWAINLPEDMCQSYKKHYDAAMEEKSWITLADSAKTLEDPTVVYDGSYRKVSYPMGDVPSNIGVCTDVVIRAYRKAFGWDLQKSVHLYLKEQHPDMKLDANIDHRRVRNLMELFDIIYDTAKLYNMHPDQYLKGNIIIWDLGGGQLHIGICVEDNMVIHNIGYGQVIERITRIPGKIIRNYNDRPDFIKSIIDTECNN